MTRAAATRGRQLRVAPRVVAAGPWDRGEFALLRAAADPGGEWPTAPTLAAAVDALAVDPAPPELILLAQARPAVDEQRIVDRLAVIAPLVRIVAVAGPWCEGELRAGRPLAGVVRVYWHEFAAWWRRAVEQVKQRGCPPWSAPLGDPRVRQWELTAGDAARKTPAGVAITAGDLATFEALAAALRPFGWIGWWRRRMDAGESRVDLCAGVWNGGQFDAAECAALARFCNEVAATGGRVVSLVDFPRAEHAQLAQAAGAAAVLGKPWQATALADELTRLALNRTVCGC